MAFQPRSSSDHAASLSVAIAPSANGRHLVRFTSPTTTFFHLGDTAWELPHRLSMDEAEFYLKNRAAKGFTGILIVLLAEHGGLDYPNRNGEWPFFPKDETPGYEPDLHRPNPAYFAFIDALIPLAASLGITLWLTPTWGRYVNGGYYGSPILFDTQTAHVFGSFLGERYPFHPFVLGGDSDRYWNPQALDHIKSGKNPKDLEILDHGDVFEAMARGIVEGESKAQGDLVIPGSEGYQTFITFHSAQVWLPSAPEASSSAQFPDAEWLSMDVVQTGHHDSQHPPVLDEQGNAQGGTGNLPMWFARSSYVPIRKMYNTLNAQGRPRPVMDLEPHYENTNHFFRLDAPVWRGRDVRSGAWQAVFAGSCGYTYGCNSIWQFHNAASTTHPPIAPPTTAYVDWYLELDLEGVFQVSLMRKIMESLPGFFDRVPDQSLIIAPKQSDEGDALLGDTLISGMRSTSWIAVHLPRGGEITVRLDEDILSDRWRAVWLDPKTGGREVFKRGTGGGSFTARSPTEGSIDNDWILLVQRDTIL